MRMLAAIMLSREAERERQHDEGNRALFLPGENKHAQLGAPVHLA